jgi:hypothetical protein
MMSVVSPYRLDTQPLIRENEMTTLTLNEIFIAADIFYGAGDDAWRSVAADKLYNNMVRDDAPRAYIALERAEIINADLAGWKAFETDRTITWENGDVETADLPRALFNGDIRRADVAA